MDYARRTTRVGSTRSSKERGPGLETLLSSDLEGPSLPHDGHAHLARVLQRLLDLLRDVAGKANRSEIINLFRLHDDPHLAARLDREALLHALERVGDLLQRLETLDVVFYALVA